MFPPTVFDDDFVLAADLDLVKRESSKRTSSRAVGFGPGGVQETGVGETPGYRRGVDAIEFMRFGGG